MRSNHSFLFVLTDGQYGRRTGRHGVGPSRRGGSTMSVGRSDAPYRWTRATGRRARQDQSIPPVPATVFGKLTAVQTFSSPTGPAERAREQRRIRDPAAVRDRTALMSCPQGQRSRGVGLRDRALTVAACRLVQKAFRGVIKTCGRPVVGPQRPRPLH